MTLWTKIKDKWTWTNKLTWVIVGGAIVLSGASLLTEKPEPESIPSIQLTDGRTIDFTFTDDNTGEDVYIYTDKATYDQSLSQAEIYLAVVNNSGDDQNIDTNLYFKTLEGRELADVKELKPVEHERTIPEYETRCTTQERAPPTATSSKTATTTVETCEQVLVGETTESFIVFEEQTIERKQFNEKAREALKNKPTKSVSNYKADKVFGSFIPSGGVAYYKAVVQFPKGVDNEKFYVEAIGDSGAYGHLDPWLDSNWTKRFKITSDNTKVAESVDNIYYDLSDAPSDLWTTGASNGNTHATDLEASSSQYWSITDGDQTNIDHTGDYAIELWWQPESTGANQYFFTTVNGGNSNYGRRFGYNSGVGGIRLDHRMSGGSQQVDWTFTPVADVKYHIAVSFDDTGTEAELWINGVSQGTKTLRSNDTTGGGGMVISDATVDPAGTWQIDGLIDDYRYCNAQITAAQIRANMHRELDGTETNLQGYWKFNNDGTDETSNGNDLTNNNSATFVTTSAFDTSLRDVRVTQSDGTTEVAFELSGVDYTGNTGSLFFDSTGIATGSDTDFYVYYGNTTANSYAKNDTYGSFNVWNSNYKGVWHMEEPSDTQRFDSTSNWNVMSDTNGVAKGTGKIESAGDYDDTNSEYLSIDDSDQTGLDITDDLTLSNWINMGTDSGSGYRRDSFIAKWDRSSSEQRSYFLSYENFDSNNTLNLFLYDDMGSDVLRKTADLGTGTPKLVRVVWDASISTVEYFVDGSSLGTESGSVTSLNSNTGDVFLGSAISGGPPAVPQNFLDGIQDEVRIYSGLLSANWDTTEYNNQNSPSTFWTTGSAEEEGAGGDGDGGVPLLIPFPF